MKANITFFFIFSFESAQKKGKNLIELVLDLAPPSICP